MITGIVAKMYWGIPDELNWLVRGRMVVEEGTRRVDVPGNPEEISRFVRGITGSGRKVEMTWGDEGGEEPPSRATFVAMFPAEGSREFAGEVMDALVAGGVGWARVTVLRTAPKEVLEAADVAADRREPGLDSSRWVCAVGADQVRIQGEVALEPVIAALRAEEYHRGAVDGARCEC